MAARLGMRHSATLTHASVPGVLPCPALLRPRDPPVPSLPGVALVCGVPGVVGFGPGLSPSSPAMPRVAARRMASSWTARVNSCLRPQGHHSGQRQAAHVGHGAGVRSWKANPREHHPAVTDIRG